MNASTLRVPEDITAEVLTELLQRMAPGTTIKEVAIQRTHQGTATHVYLDAIYGDNPAAVPSRLFVKTQLSSVQDIPSMHAEALEVEGSTCMLRDETVFYRDLRAALDVETLRVYAAEIVDGPAQFVIVAENVTDRGARFPDPAIPLSVDEVMALLRTLAQMHAQFWESPRLAVELKWVQHPLLGEFHDFLRTAGFGIIRILLEKPYKAKLLKEAGMDADLLENAFWHLQEKVHSAPITLLHGDPHPGNIYLLPDSTVGLLDWQLLRCGSWAHDVCYAIVAGLSPADRRQSEKELLRLYLAELARHGIESVPSFNEAWRLYRCSPPWGFAMWAVTPEEMYSVAAVRGVMERFGAAFVELNTIEVLGL